MTERLRSTVGKAARIAFAALLVLGMLPALHLGAPPKAYAHGDAPMNDGNPFENGDLVWDDDFQTYRLAGLSLRTGDIHETGRPGSAGAPFAYPEALKEAYDLWVQGGMGDAPGGNWPGWGASAFEYGYTRVDGNDRGLLFTKLPSTGHCGQAGNDTTTSNERRSRLMLLEEESWWEGGVYHGTFLLMVDNDHENGNFDQATIGAEYVYADWRVEGRIDLQKVSANPAVTDGNGCYSLQGAEYGVYGSEADAQADVGRVETLTTDADGYAESGGLAPGAYWVREAKAPQGYLPDERAYRVEVEPGATARVNGATVADEPGNDPVGVLVAKKDAETSEFAPQGGASLAGAQFTLEYYDGYYADADGARASGPAHRTWVYETDEDGVVHFRRQPVAGDPVFTDGFGNPTLPYGTYVYHETKAPEGYLLPDSPDVYVTRVVHDASIPNGEEPDWAPFTRIEGDRFPTEGNVGDSDTVQAEQVARGGVRMPKLDRETQAGGALGGATLEGAVFEIVNAGANPVLVDGVLHAPGAVAKTVSTGADGVAGTAADALPYGDYVLREAKAPEGYLPSDEEWAFSIREDGVVVEPGTEEAIDDQVVRGDIGFVKTDEGDMSRLAGVPFRLTSETTGESHVLVTDGNGRVDTSAAWNSHAERPNANDGAVRPDGSVDESLLDASAGVWFGLAPGGSVTAPDDSLGALPFDTYLLEELPCAANEGLELVSIAGIDVSRDSVLVDLGTIDDPVREAPRISTTATDKADGDHEVEAGSQAVIVDRIEYEGLVPGAEYEVRGTLYDKGTGEPLLVGGAKVEASAAFVPDSPDGAVEVEFAFDATALAGRTVVAFEHLYEDGVEVAAHADIEDANQTVRIVPPAPAGPSEPGKPGGLFPQTGDGAVAAAGALAFAALAAAYTCSCGLRRSGSDAADAEEGGGAAE